MKAAVSMMELKPFSRHSWSRVSHYCLGDGWVDFQRERSDDRGVWKVSGGAVGVMVR